MDDERLHLGLHLLAAGQDDLRGLGDDGCAVEGVEDVEGLLADLERFAHLLHAHGVARPDVAAVRDRDSELVALIAGVGHVAAEIPVDARGAQRRSGDAEGDGVGRGEIADLLEAAHPDGIAGEEVFILVDLGRHHVEEVLHLGVEVHGRLERDAADAEVGGHHALAGDVFKDAHGLFALAPAVEKHAHGADVEGMGAEPDQVRLDTRDLVEQHAEDLRALGDLEAEQLLDGEAVAEVVRHRTEIVDAIGQGDDLLVELGLARLLDAGMEVADVGGAGDDGLAVDLEHKTQDAVGRGVLRSHVEDHGLFRDRIVAVVFAGGVGDDVFDVRDEHFGCGERSHGTCPYR